MAASAAASERRLRRVRLMAPILPRRRPGGQRFPGGVVNAVSAEVENIVEERLAALLLRPVAIAGVITLILVPPVVMPRLGSALSIVRLLGLALRRGPLENLVELAPVEPHAAALGAIVDLDAVALGHDQVCSVDRTFHGLSFLYPAVRALDRTTRCGIKTLRPGVASL